MMFLKCSNLGFVFGRVVVKVSRTSSGAPISSSGSESESNIFFPEKVFGGGVCEMCPSLARAVKLGGEENENCHFSRLFLVLILA